MCGKVRPLVAILLVVCGVGPAAFADLSSVPVVYNDPGGDFVVSADVTLDWDQDTLIATIENTSSDQSVITAFAFMGGTASMLSVDGTLDDSDWSVANSINAPPLGTFDFAALTGNNFQGGSPHSGVLAGETSTFTFTDLDSTYTSASEFFTGINPSFDYSFALRFQSVGPDGQWSAKYGYPPDTPPDPVPAPGAAMLCLIGLSTGIVGRRSRK